MKFLEDRKRGASPSSAPAPEFSEDRVAIRILAEKHRRRGCKQSSPACVDLGTGFAQKFPAPFNLSSRTEHTGARYRDFSARFPITRPQVLGEDLAVRQERL